MSLAWERFGAVPAGGAQVQAVCDFVNGHLRFDYLAARSTRTAAEAYDERTGVCRDFAHLASRSVAASTSRHATAPDISATSRARPPRSMDFSAWFEVWLDGGWHAFDARHNQPRIGRIPIARGRDAADVPMINTFGAHRLLDFTVCDGGGDRQALSRRPRRTAAITGKPWPTFGEPANHLAKGFSEQRLVPRFSLRQRRTHPVADPPTIVRIAHVPQTPDHRLDRDACRHRRSRPDQHPDHPARIPRLRAPPLRRPRRPPRPAPSR